MTGHTSLQAQRDYYDANYRTGLIHPPQQRVVPPETVEVREFSAPCWRCNASGACRHRQALFPESDRESADA